MTSMGRYYAEQARDAEPSDRLWAIWNEYEGRWFAFESGNGRFLTWTSAVEDAWTFADREDALAEMGSWSNQVTAATCEPKDVTEWLAQAKDDYLADEGQWGRNY